MRPSETTDGNIVCTMVFATVFRPCFNEAVGNYRRKHQKKRDSEVATAVGFNEAVGNYRRKLHDPSSSSTTDHASMRPSETTDGNTNL